MPRLKARGEVFEVLYEFKQGDLDIGEAYDLIYNEIMKGYGRKERDPGGRTLTYRTVGQPKKRKLSAWNKFVRANSKKKIYQYASGKLKLKKMGIAFRKKRK